MKIFLQPREILVALLPCSAVTTRRFATGNAHELTTFKWRDFYFRSRTAWARSQEEGNRTQPAQNTSEHAVDANGNRNGKPFQKLDVGWIDSGNGKVLPKETRKRYFGLLPEMNRHAESR